jgi:2'-5' RNA ligase
MRLFLGVDLTEDVRKWAAVARRDVERARPAAASGLRWVAADQLHITLRFIGETPPDLSATMQDVFSRPLMQPAFDLIFGSVGWIPPGGRPRVLVVDVLQGRNELRALRQTADATLLRVANLGPEEREFLAHLTVARVRERSAGLMAGARHEIVGVCGNPPASPVHVDHVTLYQSSLSPRGPTYTPLARATLGVQP